jgi:hypothetical protein
MTKKNMVDVISCECLDADHWRIKYKISGLKFDDIFKRVTRVNSTTAKAPDQSNKPKQTEAKE